MAKSIYMLMKDSEQLTSSGVPRVDIISFPIADFKQNDVVIDYTLGENDVLRFDQFIRNFYGSINYYLGMIKILNGFFELDESQVGRKLKLYSKSDLDRFLRDNIINLSK